MINLMPKEKKEESTNIRRHSYLKMTIAVAGITLSVFGLCFYWGYLYHEIALREGRVEQLQQAMKYYDIPYRKIQNIESMLERIRAKDSQKQTVYAGYMAPLNALNTLIQLKTDSIWFERLQFNGLDGSFTVTGDTANYKAFASFIGKLEQNNDAFQELKPEEATVHDNSAGREYVQFKLSGILAKRGERDAQNH